VSLVVADRFVRSRESWVTGANEPDYHVRRAVLDRDFHVDVWADIAQVVTGDPCPRCGEPLSVDRGIEVGQVFQLGTKYTEALECTYTDEGGEQHPMVMGCYGIGVTRTVAAVAEEHHDDLGFAWPAAVAPYDVHLVALPGKGDQSADVVAAAERLYDELTAAGVDVLYDDRDARPGIKFADADLLGMPTRLTVGARGLERGVVERRDRATGDEDEIATGDAVAAVLASRA
jgi:prolyl-tRNA synthetase